MAREKADANSDDKLARPRHELVGLTDSWPSGLKTADEVAGAIGVSAKRLIGLANSGFAPHWRIDGGEPLFRLSEIKDWAARNLLTRIEGKAIPFELAVTVNLAPASRAPSAIANVIGLKEMPITTAYMPGVYFLVSDERIVYVGQSISPVARISQHRSSGRTFTRVFFVSVPVEMLDRVEAAFIRVLAPELNGRSSLGTPRTSCADDGYDHSVLAQYGITPTCEASCEET